MAFHPSIRIEGGLLGPDVVDQLLGEELHGQRPADFGLEGRRSLTDEIAAVFADARSLWGVFQRRLERVSADDLATSITRDAWVIPFLGLLSYDLKYNQKAYEVDGMTFAISHRAGDSDMAPPVHIVGSRQELGRVPASGRPRLAPHSLLQEFLNRNECLWGIVTNGKTLRLLRDCSFIRRQAYIEFDLQGILEEQRFQDFAALYRLLHRSRLPRGAEDARDCLLEKYYLHSVEQGGRVREHLREGVEECLRLLGNGFLGHPQNEELRRRVQLGPQSNERIGEEAFYRQLLILVYRFLFLLVSEDRSLLSSSDLYRDHYSIGRLRRLLDERAAFNSYDDIWQSLRVLWMVLTKDQIQPSLGNQTMAAALGLPVLNGELFAPQDLDSCTINNDDLLRAFWRLAWYQESPNAPARRVNYAALDVEELGSVYESLLELHPYFETGHGGLPQFDYSKGGGRKETGSYYTPPELVAELVKSALEPVIEDRIKNQKTSGAQQKALLSIRVCDPACGSGHFLLAAARRLGKELARLRTGEDEPAPERVREAIRDCISHCIYGVDRNPLAVDLCRVALWLEGHTADKPLTFLDHRIRCGDSLCGVFDLSVLTEGIPDKAFDPLEGDDRVTARELARQNREESRGTRDLFDWNAQGAIVELDRRSREVDAIEDDTPESIRRKKQLFEEGQRDPNWLRQKQACDLWSAAFFQPLVPGKPAITTAALNDHLARRPILPQVLAMAGSIASTQKLFHWPLEFPEVFADGGFDVILSNPPWEHVELKEQEFFAPRDARISQASSKAARTKLINKLEESNPTLYRDYILALRSINASRQFMAQSKRYPLTGRGRVNTYAVFAELCRDAVRQIGRAGMIIPTGIATDDTTKFYFQKIVSSGTLVSLFDFENRKAIFPSVHRSYKFCLLTLRGEPERTESTPAEFVFFALETGDIRRPEKRFTLTADEIELLNPNTGNCPIFRTQADAELTKAIYRRVPVLWLEGNGERAEVNAWRLKFSQGLFNMASDSHHFRTAKDLRADGYRLEGNVFVSPYDRYLPLYEAKMLHQFDHRWATYEERIGRSGEVEVVARDVTDEEKRDPNFVVQPRYWVREEVVESTLPKYPEPLAQALQLGHIPSVQRVLCYWAAGFYLNRSNEESGSEWLFRAASFDSQRQVTTYWAEPGAERFSKELEADHPLSESSIKAIETQLDTPEPLARDLIAQYSPKWLMGWRNVARSTDERTTIASLLSPVAVGHSLQLFFTKHDPRLQVAFLTALNSFVSDYVACQKLGGINFTYFTFKQLAIPSTQSLTEYHGFCERILDFICVRSIELLYSAHDLHAASDFAGSLDAPFPWEAERRFILRCELDAAMFHLYLPSETDGRWKLVDGEVIEHGRMAEPGRALLENFPTPRDAVHYILDQFPIVRQKDIDTHGTYRTQETILQIYDAMQDAIRTGKPYQTVLIPPPGGKF